MRFKWIIVIFSFLQLTLNGQTDNNTIFDQMDDLFGIYVKDGSVRYGMLAQTTDVDKIIAQIQNPEGIEHSVLHSGAMGVNIYNLYVMKQILDNYPITSTQDIDGFFDNEIVNVNGEITSLNKYEATLIEGHYNNPRFHFVLNCGAVGCPVIAPFAYRPEIFAEQLESQTKMALNDSRFVRYEQGKLQLSQIFNWYPNDFGGTTEKIIATINEFRDDPLPSDITYSFYNYDWTLNDSRFVNTERNTITPAGSGSGQQWRYIVSSTIPKGTWELKMFNNLYTQYAQPDMNPSRSSFFTSQVSALYGLSNRFNIGLATKYRIVRQTNSDVGAFDFFGFNDAEHTNRTGFTGVGPMIRLAPFKKLKNFSLQSTFFFPTQDDQTGGQNNQLFIDWDGPIWFTQLFNDFTLSKKWALFTELDFLYEDIGGESRANRLTTPLTAIFSHFPVENVTLYTLWSYAPTLTEDDYFYQYGLGVKQQFTPEFEIEILVNKFHTKYLNSVDGRAMTMNLGFRYSL